MLKRRIVYVNVWGALGYMFLLTAWALLGAVVVTLLIQTSILTTPPETVPPPSAPDSSSPSGMIVILGYIIAAAVILLTIALAAMLPYLLGKWSSQLLHRLFRVLHIAPTNRHLFLAKCVITTIPLPVFFVITAVMESGESTFLLIYLITALIVIVAIGCFCVQFFAARLLAIPQDKIW